MKSRDRVERGRERGRGRQWKGPRGSDAQDAGARPEPRPGRCEGGLHGASVAPGAPQGAHHERGRGARGAVQAAQAAGAHAHAGP